MRSTSKTCPRCGYRLRSGGDGGGGRRTFPQIPGGIDAQIDRFLADRCVIGPDEQVTVGDLEGAYYRWVRENGEVEPHLAQRKSAWERRFGKPGDKPPGKNDGYRAYTGVGLKP